MCGLKCKRKLAGWGIISLSNHRCRSLCIWKSTVDSKSCLSMSHTLWHRRNSNWLNVSWRYHELDLVCSSFRIGECLFGGGGWLRDFIESNKYYSITISFLRILRFPPLISAASQNHLTFLCGLQSIHFKQRSMTTKTNPQRNVSIIKPLKQINASLFWQQRKKYDRDYNRHLTTEQVFMWDWWGKPCIHEKP